MFLNPDGTGVTYKSVFDEPTFYIPSGTPDTLIQFQMNDHPLSDNKGTVRFHVKVCTGGDWGKLYDFKTENDQFGWTANFVGSFSGKWVHGDSGNYRGARIYMEIPTGCTVEQIRMGFDRTLGSWGDNGIPIDDFYQSNTGGGGESGIHSFFRPPNYDGTDIVREVTGLSITGPKRIYVQSFCNAASGSHSGLVNINYVRLIGVGVPAPNGIGFVP
jgi:hypothetical protein